ncbi:alpha/beta fold hydrolase [Phenylobacterium sp.]|uniref:alpha/beta fold hydrolase n=1 Tax=Phenylobacterium sp. TaxID=1871053 RepID=UPI0012285485|nr:alpha/beta fold hydrolase [Phenylobacterium sp.]THD60484.1 MAG: alpha/beta fold hydrolase [Phenylobacterium sp.]
MRALAFAALTFGLAGAAQAADAPANPPPKPTSRAEATEIVRGLRRIVTPNGIDRAEAVRIGGIDQWVTIRGDDRRNPVLLVLHGGPGYVETPLNWWYARGWEEYFTVVEWDQRGAGKTYLINDPKAVAPTMTRERMLQDTEEIAAWLRKDLGKRKIFVWGHSWGSYLGLELARRRPEWLYAYIATGQVTNAPESERRGWVYSMAQARAQHNGQAVRELQAIAPYPKPGRPPELKDIMVAHKWGDYFGGVMAYRHDQEDESHATRLSPDYTDAEAAHVFDGNGFSEQYLLAELLGTDLSGGTQLKVPLILLEGRHDRTVNSDVAHDWFRRVTAPQKTFVWFEHSAHEPESEEPGKFLLSLVRYARPIAQKAGDAAP